MVINNMVSVIIPNYNHAPYLKERIDSVLKQSYQDFEVIILDDCSTDNSREIINSYAGNPKISNIVFNEVNSGSTFKQWQKGFELAKGEFIWIAESDDVAHPDFLDKMMKEFGKYPNAVLGFSSMIRINERSENLGIIPLKTRGHNPMDGRAFIKDNMLFGCHILNASSAVLKKDSLSQITQDFVDFKASGDYLFWIEIANTGQVLKVEEGLDYFRHHSNKVTPRAVATGLQFKEVRKIIDKLRNEGFVSPMKLQLIAGFWQRKIRKCRIFNSAEIKNESCKLWKKNTLPPLISECFYLTYGLLRYINKKFSK